MRISKQLRMLVMIAAAVAVASVMVPLRAQQGAAEAAPTAKNPLRFTAYGVSTVGGGTGMVRITIERWTTDTERTALLGALAQGGQTKLLGAMQNIKERAGFISTGGSRGWDLKYARDNRLPDGTRQVVIVTDKPVSAEELANDARTLQYTFTMLELRFAKDGQGEGKMLAATAINVKNGRLELENYAQEGVRLTKVTQDKGK